MGRREAAEYLRSRFSLSTTPEELMDTLNDLVTEEYRSRVPMKPGADRLLARLADSGISCCIATASEAFQARSAMERLGLWPHFRFAVSCVQYGGKTRPDIYLEAARRLGTVPAETVVFEDALHAARTAYEAGFRVCGVWDVSARRGSGRAESPGGLVRAGPGRLGPVRDGEPRPAGRFQRRIGGTTFRRLIKLQCKEASGKEASI